MVWNYLSGCLYDKNDILPSEIGVGVHKKVWWKCPFGHSYLAYPSNRCGKTHSGCPICDKENHTSFSEQALFYYVKKCFPDAINSDRTAIGMELDIYIPSLKIAMEYDGRNWHQNNKTELKKNRICKEKGIFLMRIREEGLDLYDDCYCIVRNDVSSNKSLAIVINKILEDIEKNTKVNIDIDRDATEIYNSYVSTRKSHSLLNEYPELSKEWHPSKNGNLTPEMVAPMTNKKVWWLGTCGHEWQMAVYSRAHQKCGCPICAGKQILKGYNDLQTKYPDLCDSWDYNKNTIGPDMVTSHSDKRVWWKCPICDNEWHQKVDIVVRSKENCNSNGCPKCGLRINAKAKYKKVICLETQVIYESIKQAGEKTNINKQCISMCVRGVIKSAGGYHWEYYNTSDK